MSTNITSQMLAVRLAEPRKRYLKALAAGLGLSLQEAVEQALDMWLSQHQQPGATIPVTWHDSPAANAGPKRPGQQNRAAQRQEDRPRDPNAKAARHLQPVKAQIPKAVR